MRIFKFIGILFTVIACLALCMCSDGGNGNTEDNASRILSGINISHGTLSPGFEPSVTAYTADVKYIINEITVSVSLNEAEASVKINNTLPDKDNLSAMVTLVQGENVIVIAVADNNDGSEKKYILTVTRAAPGTNADLAGLFFSKGILSPVFRPERTEYNVEVDSDLTSITVTPTVDDYNAKLTVDSIEVTSGASSHSIDLKTGVNTIPVVVTAEDGKTRKSYTIYVRRLSSLNSSTNTDLVLLQLSDAVFEPEFAADVLSYTARVGNEISSLTVTAVPAGVGACVLINNTLCDVNASVNLDAGENTIDVRIVAGDGITFETYSITVTRVSGAPGAARITSGNPGQLSLSWDELEGAVSYEVWYNSSGDSSSAVRWPEDISETENEMTGLSNNTDYFIWLKAKNAAGTSDFGPVSCGTPVNFNAPASPGDQLTVLAGSTSFNMNCGCNDDSIIFPVQLFVPGSIHAEKIERKFYVSETEVTNELMMRVLEWAYKKGYISETGASRNRIDSSCVRYASRNLLDFDDSSISYSGSGVFAVVPLKKDFPVTGVSWYGAVMFCNWLTEMRDGDDHNNVYSGITDSWSDQDTVEDAQKSGYRLPSFKEWEFCARYLGHDQPETGGELDSEYICLGHNDSSIKNELTPDYFWTPGDYASGAFDDCSNSESTGLVAWYNFNCSSGPQRVGQKSANFLGLFDVCGNVREWTFSQYNSSWIIRGGCWDDSAGSVQLGESDIPFSNPLSGNIYTGFRIVRSVR